MVFEYSGVQDPDAVDIGCQEFGLEPLESYPIDGEDPFITALKEIKHADQYADQGHHRLFDSRFYKTVYRKTPSIDYFRNWMYCLKQSESEDQLPEGVLTAGSYWIIFQKKIDQIQPKRKLRPDQEDKLNVQKIAKEVWKQFPLDIKYMKMHPDIKNSW
ncbi:MAG: hypothetical protein SRB1_01317 [Desulfobacteraceae bacterium Eth-SRB1]|nr:MAG: hypothetical protein SRB1_01317 [Desulfobacteraceae bacterium Eth-SRB1]